MQVQVLMQVLVEQAPGQVRARREAWPVRVVLYDCSLQLREETQSTREQVSAIYVVRAVRLGTFAGAGVDSPDRSAVAPAVAFVPLPRFDQGNQQVVQRFE